eukprot:166334-Hanusia_phi.AAC.1
MPLRRCDKPGRDRNPRGKLIRLVRKGGVGLHLITESHRGSEVAQRRRSRSARAVISDGEKS